MAVSIPVLVLVISFHLIAFVLAVGAERRRSTVNPFLLSSFSAQSTLHLSSILLSIECVHKGASSTSSGTTLLSVIIIYLFIFWVWKAKVVPDEYDERTYCVYGTDASTAYGLSAFGLLLICQTVLSCVTKCLCCGRGMMGGKSTSCAIFFFVFSW